METNDCVKINYKNGYYFEICKEVSGFIIMGFNYYNYGLNLSSEKNYTKLSHALSAGKNILNNHMKRNYK